MQRMIDAVDSPAWGELDEWVSALPDGRRTVHVAWAVGRWHVSLYEHACLPSHAIAASADTYGQTDESLAVVVRRALAHVEVSRAATRARALAELRVLAGGDL
jgi:hypothetical protein